MPRSDTTHFGQLEYTPGAMLTFSEGLPGFETEHSFVLVEQPHHHPLVFLQSIATPALCFPALPVRVVDPAYEPNLSENDLDLLGFSAAPSIGADALVLALIAVREQEPTANLLAPVVVNLRTRTAAQCVDPEMRHSHRYPLAPALEAAS